MLYPPNRLGSSHSPAEHPSRASHPFPSQCCSSPQLKRWPWLCDMTGSTLGTLPCHRECSLDHFNITAPIPIPELYNIPISRLRTSLRPPGPRRASVCRNSSSLPFLFMSLVRAEAIALPAVDVISARLLNYACFGYHSQSLLAVQHCHIGSLLMKQ